LKINQILKISIIILSFNNIFLFINIIQFLIIDNINFFFIVRKTSKIMFDTLFLKKILFCIKPIQLIDKKPILQD